MNKEWKLMLKIRVKHFNSIKLINFKKLKVSEEKTYHYRLTVIINYSNATTAP